MMPFSGVQNTPPHKKSFIRYDGSTYNLSTRQAELEVRLGYTTRLLQKKKKNTTIVLGYFYYFIKTPYWHDTIYLCSHVDKNVFGINGMPVQWQQVAFLSLKKIVLCPRTQTQQGQASSETLK